MIFEASRKETGSVDKICQLNFTLCKLFADATRQIAGKLSIPLSEIDIVGTHGQTIYHVSSLKEKNDKEARSTLHDLPRRQSNQYGQFPLRYNLLYYAELKI